MKMHLSSWPAGGIIGSACLMIKRMKKGGLMAELPVRRSLLFVPADRPQLFEKATAGPADMICLELEDGVGPDHKDKARAGMLSFMTGFDGADAEVLVRINHPDTPAGEADLAAILSVPEFPAGIMIPKISSADQLRDIDKRLAAGGCDSRLYILIETNSGLEQCFDILRASDRLEMVLFGGVDLSAELRCRPAWEPLLYARQRVVHAAATAGIDVMDMPYLNIADQDGLLTEARAAADIGFTGKAAIHPAQLATLHQAFTPAEEQVAWAQKVIAAYQQSETGVTVLEGRLVERPVVDRMRRILALARAAGKTV